MKRLKNLLSFFLLTIAANVLGMILFGPVIYAQVPNNFPMPTIIPASPEMHSLGKFGDIPTSNYTGVPDISIPVYTVKVGKLSLPINLCYHASGIEVSQESSWVGLGWNLLAGGQIALIPVGGFDDPMWRLNWNEFQPFLNYMGGYPDMKNEDHYVDWECISVNPSQTVTSNVIKALLCGAEAHDVFSANFLNYSFKFIKSPKDVSSYIFVGQKNKCVIVRNPGEFGFVITGEDGTIYRFDCQESHSSYIFGWYLTKIISSTGDTISLRYKTAQVKKIPALNERYSVHYGSGGAGGSTHPQRESPYITETTYQYLEEIETRNELIIFESDNNRLDLNGGYKLSRIIVRDKFNQVDKFNIRFKYDYFSGCSVGGDFLNDGGDYSQGLTADNKSKRLKLDSLIIGTSVSNNNYVFNYYQQVPLPYKTSFAVDHWGYYNGQENSSFINPSYARTIIPNLYALSVARGISIGDFPAELFFNGATRGASGNFITAGMLHSIQYPTKGKTVFKYESHDFNNYKYLSAEDEPDLMQNYNASVQFIADYPAYSVTEDEFTVSHRTSVHFIGYTEYYNDTICLEGIQVEGGFTTRTYRYTGQQGSEHLAEWDEYFWLDPGVYRLRCTVSGNSSLELGIPIITGDISYFDHDEELLSAQKYIGGGVRIKSIVNYDEYNNILTSKKYSYIKEDGTTSGRLLIPLINYEQKNITIGHAEPDPYGGCPYTYTINRPTYTLYGSSYVYPSTHPFGNNVGYDRVVVETYSDLNNIGKEIQYFSNNDALLMHDRIPYFLNNPNGNLIKRILQNDIGDTVFVEKSEYSILQDTETAEILNAYAEDLYSGPTDICCVSYNPLAYIGRFNIYSYPTRNYYSTLMTKNITNYLPTGKVSIISSYTYNPNNFSIKSTRVSTSENSISKYYDTNYPVDFPANPILSSMVAKNQINIPIEQSEYINTNNKFTITTNFELQNNSFYAPGSVTSKKGNYNTETRLVYDKYDNYGNITEVHQADNIKESYIYGYNHCYPVVKGTNIDEATLNTRIQQSLPAGFSTIDALLLNSGTQPGSAWNAFNSNLRNSCPNSFITTYTYDPVYGMTSATNANNITTYYEYDELGRLKLEKDSDGHILKTYEYHFK
ncbi:MAG TPA: RHS repeat domain-containing protein [Bacteroidales bacterium]|nr:RHS repeat domain-containing protein [Bacteroidales bacterium]